MRNKRKLRRTGVSRRLGIVGTVSLLAGLVAVPSVIPGVAGAKNVNESSGEIVCDGPQGVLGSTAPITGYHNINNWDVTWMVNGVDAADLTGVQAGDIVSVSIAGYSTNSPVHIGTDEIIGESGSGGNGSIDKVWTASGTGTSNATFDDGSATGIASSNIGGTVSVSTEDQAGVQYLLVDRIAQTLTFPPIMNNDGQFNFSISDIVFNGNGTASCNIPAAAQSFTVRGIPIPKAPTPATDRAAVDAYYSAEADADTNTMHTVSIDVLANDADPDGAGPDAYADLDITQIIVPPLNGTVDCGALPGDGPCLYTPNDGYSGTDVFSYEVVDAGGLTAIATVVVTVHGNGAPVAVGASEMVPYGSPVGTPINFALTGDTDPDGDGLVYNTTLIDGPTPGVGTVTMNGDGTYTWTPTDDTYEGMVTFTYEVCDDHALVVPATETGVDDGVAPRCVLAEVVLYVGDNQPPLVTNDETIVDSWYSVDTSIDGTDAAETVTDAGHSVTIDVLGNDSDPDLPGSIAAPGLTIIQAGVLNIVTLTFDSGVSANGGTVVINADGTITYTAPDGFEGIDGFIYEVEDVSGAKSIASVQIGVIANQAPVATPDSFTGTFGTDVAGSVAANDLELDGETLVYNTTPVVAPVNGTVVLAADGTFTYTPNAGFAGLDSFTYEVCDDHFLIGGDTPGLPAPRCRQAVVTLNVVNTPPTALVDNAATTEDLPVDIDLLVNDFDAEDTPGGLALTVTSVETTSLMGGTVVDNGDGTVTYTPADGFCGLDSFGYTIEDSGGLPGGAVALVVVSCDEVPNAEDDSANTSFNTAVDISYTTNDSDTEDGTPALDSFDAASTEGGVVVDNGDGTFGYTPAADFCGVDSFNYAVIDSNGQTDTATVTIHVTCMNDDEDGDGIPDWVEVIICGTTTCADGTEDTDGNGIPDWTEIIICGAAGCVDTGDDSDGDGIPDWVEIIVCGTTTCATGAEDTDGDGIPDWVEVLLCGTTTCAGADDDSDGDGIPDWIEIIICGSATCADGTEDSDGDGVPDWIEIIICGSATCANAEDDSDGDGIPDWIEVTVCGTATCLDPSTDTDGDGIPDWVEVIICGTATCADGTEDTDGNGIPDWQEIATCGEAGCMLDYLRTKTVGSCSNTATFTIPGTLEYDIPNGFRSNTDIRIYMFSEPVLLYSGVLPDSGKVSLAIPAGVTPGKHKFMVIGVDDITGSVKIDGCSRNGVLPGAAVAGAVQAPAAATGTKTAVTGARVTSIVIAGSALVGAGLCLFLLGRRRRRTGAA